MAIRAPHSGERHTDDLSSRLNWLRAAVLGANDGIVSTAGLVIGIAGAGSSHSAIVTAGFAGLFAGSLSMAAGEYVSVSSQRDSERAQLAMETKELAEQPEDELAELTQIYRGKGLDQKLARQVAVQLTQRDALGAHAEVELKINPNALTNPVHAAAASSLAFMTGAALPLATIALVPSSTRLASTVVAVVIALVITGIVSATLGRAQPLKATARNVIGGMLAMATTYGIGVIVGGSYG